MQKPRDHDHAAVHSQVQPSAISHVLNTNELLEQILKHLDCRTLLGSGKLVSKTWKTLVETSPKLRWKTWQWTGKNPPPSVIGDPALRSSYGERFYYEFAGEDALYWLGQFWRTTVESLMMLSGEDRGGALAWDWMVQELPHMELLRPRLKGRAVVAFELSYLSKDAPMSPSAYILAEGEITVANDELTLRKIASLIFEKALSSRGMGLASSVWERTRDGKLAVGEHTLEVTIYPKSMGSRKNRQSYFTSRMLFDFKDLGARASTEYWMPSKEKKGDLLAASHNYSVVTTGLKDDKNGDDEGKEVSI